VQQNTHKCQRLHRETRNKAENLGVIYYLRIQSKSPVHQLAILCHNCFAAVRRVSSKLVLQWMTSKQVDL
jgi:hypothetical protein